jgi:tetratricopeptide (TPR) repeat protein
MTPLETLEVARAGDLERLDAQRAGVAHAVNLFANLGDAASALELLGRTWRIWLDRGEIDEGSTVMAAALAIPRNSAIPIWHARVLYADGLFAFRAGDQARSRASNETALRVARESDDVRGECDALTGLARVALRDGRYDDVVALAQQARERARLAGDLAAGASPLHLHAAGVRLRGDYRAAHDLYLESLRLNTELNNAAAVSMELSNLGWVELHLGDVESAKARFHARDAAATTEYADAWAELGWAAVAVVQGDAGEARRRYLIGQASLDRLGRVLDPDDKAELEWLGMQVGA